MSYRFHTKSRTLCVTSRLGRAGCCVGRRKSWNDEFERVKEIQDHLLEEGAGYTTKEARHRKTLLEKEVATKAMT